jgi:alginate O-acetyltransferase complex protein AlgI
MLFNSFEFLIFFPVVFFLHWFVFKKNKSSQNLFLIIVSYFFYSCWDWRFSFLLGFSTILDYFSGIFISNSNDLKTKRNWMRLSIFINLGILCYFKYTNFFIGSFIQLFQNFGFHCDHFTLKIILPIGISFYTFHGISYVLDNYYGRIKATTNIVEYSLFVSFFPLLVAGPIERATHLLPQLTKKREFNYVQSVEGCRLILWGMFKKVVIADSLAPIVEDIFSNYQNHSGITLIIGVVSFAFQVYGDFSGYTDIARGISKLLGIELILNFNFPYFSRSIPEFWSRWHISLSSWLNDYVFTPLALNFRHRGRIGIFIAIFTTFIISGFWHGAGLHFIVWGAYYGLLYIPYVFSKKGIKSMVSKKTDSVKASDLPNIILTFSLVCLGYVFFRSPTLSSAFGYLSCIINNNFLHYGLGVWYYKIITPMLLIIVIFFLDWINRREERVLSTMDIKVNSIIYVTMSVVIMLHLLRGEQAIDFIYFQF